MRVHFVVHSYLEENMIFLSPLWEDWWTHGIRVYNHIPPVELLWCGLLFLWGSFGWTHPPATAVCRAHRTEAEVVCPEAVYTHMTLTGYINLALYVTVLQWPYCMFAVIFLTLNHYYFVAIIVFTHFADVSPDFPDWFGSLQLHVLHHSMQNNVTQHLFIKARFSWRLMCSSSNEAFLDIPSPICRGLYDITLTQQYSSVHSCTALYAAGAFLQLCWCYHHGQLPAQLK